LKKAIVAGATSGIGRELARLLAGASYRVGITGRRLHLLEELKSENPAAYVISSFDIRCPGEAAEKLEALAAELGGLDLLVISSGTGDINPGLTFGTEKETIDTNVTGFTSVAGWAYNYFGNQGHGHLVAVTSLGGIRGSGEVPAYNASKAYQINYLEGLRQRARRAGSGVHITDIRPGLVNTAMAKGDGLFWVMPLNKAASQIYRAIVRKKRVAVITRRWRIISILLKILPRTLYERL